MKNYLIILCCCAIVGCSSNYEEPESISSFQNLLGEYFTINNRVTKEDVLKLKEGQLRITRGSYTLENKLYCIRDSACDTLLFVCDDANGGWTIYSTDTRVPAIVAYSDSGSFANVMKNDNAYAWIMTMAEDMKTIKHLQDSDLNFSAEEIENNRQFWAAMSSTDEHVKEHLIKTRSGLSDELVLTPNGHYEFSFSNSHIENYDSTYRLTNTNWAQDSPCNDYCPKKRVGSGRAPAGCTAIAAAQMLYYIRMGYFIPITAPSTAYCNSYIDQLPYDWNQTNFNSNIWFSMDPDGNFAAPLIAYVGRLLNLQYGDDDSPALNPNFKTDVFEQFGVDCTQMDFNPDTLTFYLRRDRPVLLTACCNIVENGIRQGHAFIADRYKRQRIVTENHYVWEYDFYPPHTPLPVVPDSVAITYSSPVVSMIGMNWGWGAEYNHLTEWHALTGDWILDSINYNQNRKMVYNFKPMNIQ